MEPNNHENDGGECDWKPRVHMTFDTEQEAYDFYITYGGRLCLLLLQPRFLHHNMHFSMPSMYSVHGTYQALLNNASSYHSQASNSPACSEVIYFSPFFFYFVIHSFKVPFYFMVPLM